MLKKLLFFIIYIFSLSAINAQVLPLDIFKENRLNSKSTDSKTTFKEITTQYQNYFSDKDVDKKGSGYKPFKRWEYHWSHYLLDDGTIAPSETLWKAWEQKQKMANSSKAASNWTDKGPFSQSSNSGQGRINTVLVDPNNANTIYVGAPAGGLWKSTDAGINWTPLTDDLPQIGVSGIAVDPNDSNIIYISTGDDDAGDSYSIGVLKSTDGGMNWNPTGNLGNITGTVRVGASAPISNEILIDPTDSNIIWVATGAGLFKSTNAGTTWVNNLSGDIKDFKLKPGEPSTVYAVSSTTFYRSISGSSFAAVTVGLPASNTVGALRVEVSDAAPNNVYIVATDNSYAFQGVYISTTSGSIFSKTLENDDIFGSSQAWFDLAFAVSPTNANEMYVGVLDIWKSTGGGNNFTKINDWRVVNQSFTHADIHFLRFYNGTLYAGTDGGVYRSTDGGANFTDLTQNLSISQFYRISVSKGDSNKFAGGLQDNGGFSLTNNTWHNYHGGDGMDAASDPNDENTFYGFLQNGGTLFKTNDGGLSIVNAVSGPSQGNWVTPLVINKGSEVYAGYDQLYKLNDNSWTQVSDYFFGGNIAALEIDPSNNDNIFVSRGVDLYKSTDKGVTFNLLTTGILKGTISSIEVHNSNSNIVWITTAGISSSAPSSGYGGGSVYKSTDGGLNFTNITSGLPSESKFVVRHHPFSDNNSIYVGTALGVYHLNDDISEWEVFSTNLPNVAVSDIEINPYDNTITAATYGRSVWQSPIPAVTIPAYDIDLLNINLPDNVLICGEFTQEQVSPKLNVFNNGQNAITSFTVNYNIDGGATQIYNYTGNIAPNTSAEVILPASTFTNGIHTVNANVELTNDANQYNNSSQGSFAITSNPSGEVQYVNTFGDVNMDTWIVSENNLWEIGSPTTSDLNGLVTSGYVTNASGNYPDGTTSYLFSPCYNLSNLQDPVLKFKMAFDLEENWDIMYVEYSTDQGDNWQILGTANDPNWYNSDRTNASSGSADDCQNCPGAQWTGFDNVLKEYSYDLTSLNGESSIIFRFTFVSDNFVNEEGVVIDDFVIDATAVLSINDFEEGEFLLYPNPSSDIFNITRFNTVGENMTVKVFDLMGKLIYQRKNIVDRNYKLNMNGFSKGIYFLHVNIENKRLVKKLLLK